MMIDKTHLLEAAHVCYADHYARLAEGRMNPMLYVTLSVDRVRRRRVR